MKLLLLSAFCFFAFAALAQIPHKSPRILNQDEILRRFKGTNNDTLRKQFQEYLRRRGFSNDLLANKRGNMAILPQDHMPCIVPDTNAIASIPNAWKGTTLPYRPSYHPIPNPALPKQQSFNWNALDNSLGIPAK